MALPPSMSVIVPTYNRQDLLRRTLAALAAQRYDRTAYEVVVADDGSTDATPSVVDSFRSRMRMGYFRQEDEGFRAAAARNGGARLANGSVLTFIDTGTIVGPDFVQAHLAAHQARAEEPAPVAVVGYAYGYNQADACARLDDLLRRLPPEEVRARLAMTRGFLDRRHAEFAASSFDARGMIAPWSLFWTVNVSVDASAFWVVGGFDEGFRSWGVEDVELGYRLARHGGLRLSRQAWAIEAPHPRDMTACVSSNRVNAAAFHDKHPEPYTEMFWANAFRSPPDSLNEASRSLAEWSRRARRLEVHDEIAQAIAALPDSGAAPRVAVFGCGGRIPTSPARLTLVDFDRGLLDRAVRHTPYTGVHALGLRTRLPAGDFDLVVVTSRLAGQWDRWGEAILAEAGRLGGTVTVPFLRNLHVMAGPFLPDAPLPVGVTG